MLTTHDPDHALQLRWHRGGHGLTETRLTVLYDIDVHLINYRDHGVDRQVIITG